MGDQSRVPRTTMRVEIKKSGGKKWEPKKIAMASDKIKDREKGGHPKT